MIKWHRARFSAEEPTIDWYAEENFVVLARAANTSHTGSEDYPWEWYLTDHGESRARTTRVERIGRMERVSPMPEKTYGQQDTLRSVKQVVAYLLGESSS